jgi:hypothetical protein
MKELETIDKWSEGIDVREESESLARLIGEMDFYHYSDYFRFKFGGDGDNGETLAYIIDDLIDHGFIEVKILQNGKTGKS